MADNTLGSGYLYNAKPFNVINPTGIDPGQSVDILKEVSENAKNRAFQAGQNERNRQNQLQMTGMELDARAQEGEKGRQHETNLRQQEMQQQDAQYQQDLALRQQMEAARQKEEKRRRTTELTITKVNEQTAARVNQITEEYHNYFNSANEDLALTNVAGKNGDFLSPGGAVLPAHFISPEKQKEKVAHLAILRNKLRDANEANARAHTFAMAVGTIGDGKTTNDGNSVFSQIHKVLNDSIEAHTKHSAEAIPRLDAALRAYNTEQHLESFGYGSDAWRFISGQTADFENEARQRLFKKGISRSNYPAYGGDGDEKYNAELKKEMELMRYEKAGLPAPPTTEGKRKALASEFVKTIGTKSGEEIHAQEIFEKYLTLLDESVDAKSVSEETAKLRLAGQHLEMLKQIAEPVLVENSIYQMSKILGNPEEDARAAGTLAGLKGKAGEPPPEGEVDLTPDERMAAATQGSRDKIRLAKALQKAQFSTIIKVGPDGSARMAPAFDNWGEIPAPLSDKKFVDQTLTDIAAALTKADNPVEMLKRIANTDPAVGPSDDGMGGPLDDILQKMKPEDREIFSDAIRRTYSRVQAEAALQGYDPDNVPNPKEIVLSAEAAERDSQNQLETWLNDTIIDARAENAQRQQTLRTEMAGKLKGVSDESVSAIDKLLADNDADSTYEPDGDADDAPAKPKKPVKGGRGR